MIPMDVLGWLETGFEYIAQFGIIILEYVGAAILLTTAVRALVSYFRHQGRTSLVLGHGIALALEFMLVGEILRASLVRTLEEILVLGGIVAVRAALTLLIHWEIKSEGA